MNTTHGWLSSGLLALLLASAGCSGDNGAAGSTGADGMNGVDGKNGVDGIDGKPGKDGADGMDGIDGKDGKNGKDGVNGEDGADADGGVDGKDGKDGKDGMDGMDGVDGVQGPAGQSGIIDRTKLTGVSKIYPLTAQLGSGISGDVRFAEFVDGTTHGTLITIRITGPKVPDSIRSAHVHYNTVTAGGSPAITLNKVDGFTADGTGISETLVTHVDAAAANAADANEVFVAGHAIDYTQLTGGATPANGFNGYVNVHWLTGDNGTGTMASQGIAAGNIGKN